MAMRSALSRISFARSIYSTRGAFTRVFRGDDRKADSIKDRRDLEMIGEDYRLQKDDKAETNKNDADEKSTWGVVWDKLMKMAGKDKGAADKNKDVPIWWEDNPFWLYEAYKAVRNKRIDNLEMYDGEWLSEVDETNIAIIDGDEIKDLEMVGEDCSLYKEDKAETNKNAVHEKLAWAMVWETLMEMIGKDQGAADENKDVRIWWEDNPFLLYEAYKAVRDKKIDNLGMYDGEWLFEVDKTNSAIIDGDEKLALAKVWETLMEMTRKDQGAADEKKDVRIWWEDNPFSLYEVYKAVRDKKIDNLGMYDGKWLSEVDKTNTAIIDGDEIKDLDMVGEDYWLHEDDKAERNKNAADEKSTWGMVWEKLMKMAGKDQGAVKEKPEGAHRG